MIGNMTNHLITPSYFFANNTTTFSDNSNTILNNIKNIHNQPIGLINIPIELKQKIAFNLDGISYCNLRLTTSEMSNSLPSFKAMLCRLKTKCSGEIQGNYINMYANSIKQLLQNETNKDVIECLMHASADRHYTNDNSTSIYTKYSPDATVLYGHWSGGILLQCKEKIIELSNNQLITNVILIEFKSPDALCENCLISLDINDECINSENFHFIFEAFNEMLNEERSNDRFLVAICAIRLRDYWCNNPPAGINKQDLMDISYCYPTLFSIGMIVSDYISESNK